MSWLFAGLIWAVFLTLMRYSDRNSIIMISQHSNSYQKWKRFHIPDRDIECYWDGNKTWLYNDMIYDDWHEIVKDELIRHMAGVK